MSLQMFSPTKMDRGSIYLRPEEQLWHQIDKLHISYLEAEESPRKIEEKRNLEALIREYLSIVPHEKKFSFRETADVLHKSVEGIEDFSAFRATTAWTSLAGYAHNLIAQPWRKEFREIKTYSGFYKHNIETSLVGGEKILQLMGYQLNGQGSMVLQNSVDQQRVTMVSKDAFIALVECQIMRTIFADMVKFAGDITWFDVLQYREAHICSPEEAVKALLNIIHQQYYSYPDVQMYPKYAIDPMGCQPYRYAPSMAQQAMYMHANQSSYGSYLQQQQPMGAHYPLCSNNGYYTTPHNNYQSGASMRAYSCSVPTAQLIEFDSTPCTTSSHHKRSISDVKDRSNRQTSYDDYIKTKPKESKLDHHWGHSYGRSVNTNYQSKDDMSELDATQLLQSLHLTDMHSKPGTVEPNYVKYDVHNSTRRKTKDYSTVDSANSTQTVIKDKRKILKENNATAVESKDYWACSSCTYHNKLHLKVCEICNKSRTQGNEIQPLISGGSECPHCTLVNEKGVKKCALCSNCLKNSPTYI